MNHTHATRALAPIINAPLIRCSSYTTECVYQRGRIHKMDITIDGWKMSRGVEGSPGISIWTFLEGFMWWSVRADAGSETEELDGERGVHFYIFKRNNVFGGKISNCFIFIIKDLILMFLWHCYQVWFFIQRLIRLLMESCKETLRDFYIIMEMDCNRILKKLFLWE